MMQHQLLWIIYTVLVPCCVSQPMFMPPAGRMDGDLAPILDMTPVTVTAQAGADAQLSCRVRNLGQNSVTWFDKDYVMLTSGAEVMANNHRLRIDIPYEGEFILTIKDVRPADSGTYNCMVQVFPPQMKDVQLVVTAIPSINSTSIADTAIAEGKHLVKICRASGIPSPTVSWYTVQRDPDTFQDTRELYVDGDRLEVRNIRKSDGGRYLCRAQNEHGIAEQQMSIDILYRPAVESTVREVTVTSGDSAVLECSVDMNPKGTLRWLRNDNLLLNTWKYSLARYNDRDTKKVFLRLTVRQTEASDTGIYMCTARNMVGEDKLHAQIHVLEPTTTPEPIIPPVIDTSRLQMDYVFMEGTGVNITCHVSGRPSPQVTWFKYVGDILAMFMEGEMLVIGSIQREDSGHYTCEAVNEHSTVSYMVNIDVHYPPAVTATQPSLNVTQGSTITLQCSVDSNPSSQIVWKFNSLTMSNSWKVKEELYRDFGQSSSHLTIKQVDFSNAGQYICVAKNYLGENSVVVGVEVVGMTTEASPSTTTTVIEQVNMVTTTEPIKKLGPKISASATNSAVAHVHLDVANALCVVLIFVTTHYLS